MNREESAALDLLLQRLLWPSLLVRERSAVALASLLRDPGSGAAVLETLLAWMRRQPFESTVAIGFLALAQLKIQGGTLVPWERVESAIQKPSLLSWLIATELYGEIAPPSLYEGHSGTAPKSFSGPSFFDIYVQAYVPPSYLEWAEQIEARTMAPFIRQWTYEWLRIVDALEIRLTRPSQYFSTNPDREHVAVWDLPLSEVYRSSFLRALAWAVDRRVLNVHSGLFFAARTCPIDLGLWGVSPGNQPPWWPGAGASNQLSPEGQGLRQSLEALWHRQSEGSDVVIEASGRVQESLDSWCDVEIAGIVRCNHDGTGPPLGEVASDCGPERVVLKFSRPLVLGGSYASERPEDWEQRYGDWRVWRLAAPVAVVPVGRWQYWRMFREVWLPSPFLAETSFSVRCTKTSVSVDHGGSEVARWSDWTLSLEEKAVGSLPPSTGQILLAKRQMIELGATRLGGIFGWLCRVTFYGRRSISAPLKRRDAYYLIDSMGVTEDVEAELDHGDQNEG
jgi:hypothetical protein